MRVGTIGRLVLVLGGNGCALRANGVGSHWRDDNVSWARHDRINIMTGNRANDHYSLFTLRKPRFPLRINVERGFLRGNRL